MRTFHGAFALALGMAVGSGFAAEPGSSHDTLRQIMEQARLQSGIQPNRPVGPAVSPERLQERARLLVAGEAALAQLQLETALRAFEHAALILHAADTEIALVRSYMQGGNYRRALAFGAHTAGAHLDVVGGSALYAWLLHAGGQGVIAQRLLTEAQARMPGHALLDSVQQQLRSGAPRASGALLAPPTRLAPYGDAQGLPASARVAGSGLLLPGGEHALVPLALLPRSGRFWLRNGLGQLARATVSRRLPDAGIARVTLSRALPSQESLELASRDPFPGSVGVAVEFIAGPDAAPAWPVLHTGFLGNPTGLHGARLLGIKMPPGPRGGPVFDSAGRLVGLALPGTRGQPDRLVPASHLRRALPHKSPQAVPTTTAADIPEASAKTGPAPLALSVDAIYEASLRSSLQVITLP